MSSGISRRARLNWSYFFAYAAVFLNVSYLNLFLQRNGFSGAQIGTLWVVMTMTGVFLVPPIAARFDRAGRPAWVLAALAAASGLLFCCYSLPVAFLILIGVTLIFAVTWNPVQPFINSLVLDEIAAEPDGPAYGAYRAWGSLGFAAAGGAAGVMMKWFDIWVIFPAFLISGLAIMLLAYPLSSRTPAVTIQASLDESRVKALLRSRIFLMVMLVNFFLVMGHLMGWTLRGIYLDWIGVSESHVGFLIVAPTLTEIVVFAKGEALRRRFGIRNLILIGSVFTGLRWVFLASVTNPVLLYFTELIHGVGFPMFLLGLIEYMRLTIPKRRSATAQVLVFSSSNGVGVAAGALASGVLLDAFGPRLPLYVGGVVSALAGITHYIFLRNPGDRRTKST